MLILVSYDSPNWFFRFFQLIFSVASFSFTSSNLGIFR